jgi:hypothetical protein
LVAVFLATVFFARVAAPFLATVFFARVD